MGWFANKTQSPAKTTQTDPFRNYRPEQQYTENILKGMTSGSNANFGSVYAAPSALQTRSMNDMERYMREGRPLYDSSAKELERVAGGAYLDPTSTSQYQNYKSTQMNLANQ